MDTPQRAPVASMFDAWGAEAAAEGRFRHALLRAARDGAVLQDQIDCAETAVACGLRGAAAALYGLVFLRLGFSSTGLAVQRQVDERTGLWGGLRGPAKGNGVPGFSVDLAVAELRALMRLTPALPVAPAGIGAVLPADAMPLPAAPDPGAEERLARLGDRASAVLRDVPRLAAEGKLADLLVGLVDEVAAIRPVHVAERLDQDAARLASLFALEGLRRFLAANRDLLHVQPSGSPLLEAASRLDPAALGPFFSNVGMVIRDARDVFGLIEAAAGRRPGRDELEAWCVLLSAHLPRGQVLDLIDELGDRGLARALRSILVRVASFGGADRPLDAAWRIRDVALDIGDLALAADAQHLVALWSPTDRTEWTILGDIRAAMEDRAGAAEAFSRALFVHPDNRDVLRRLVALRSGRRFEVTKGYGTSAGRYRLRRARLEAFAKAG